jgi:hypothetical protein
MRVSRMLARCAAAALLGGACSEDDTTGIPSGLEVFTATLNGANERPTAVTTTATGTAIVTALGNQLSWRVDITSAIDSVTIGHIHKGVADSAGGVIRDLAPTPTGIGFTGTVALGSAIVVDSVLTLMRDGRAYVNIHTRAHGAGEIRGQLVKQ